jgi:hypothetical protein
MPQNLLKRIGSIHGYDDKAQLPRSKEMKKDYVRLYDLDNEDRRKYKEQYRRKNREKVKDYVQRYDLERQQYRLRNSEKKKDYERQYGLENKEKRESKNRAFRANNVDLLREYNREKFSRENETPRKRVVRSWKSPASIREFFESLRGQLHISNLSDWYRISRTQIYELGGMQFNLVAPFLH